MRLLYKLTIVLVAANLFFSCGRAKITDPEDDSLPPLTPLELKVFAAFDGQIGIEWKKNLQSNIKGYSIYRSINKPNRFEKISFTENNYFIEKYLFYDSTYYYKISAVNRNNAESPLTISVSAKPINIYAPVTPKRLIISAYNRSDSIGVKLSWNPSADSDILGYKIYRSTSTGFNADSLNYLNFTTNIFYIDTKQIRLLTNYYYKIIAVDKGGLISPSTSEATDFVLNSPVLVFPANNSIINSITEFRLIAVSRPAKYKLVISTNEIYGTILESNFSSNKVDEEIKVSVPGLQLDQFRRYFWRIYTYTASDSDPNSYSAFYTFTYYPTN